MDNERQEIWKKIDKMYGVIFEGNGKPSINVQLATVNERLEMICNKLDAPCIQGQRNTDAISALKWVGGLVVMALFAVIGYFHLQ